MFWASRFRSAGGCSVQEGFGYPREDLYCYKCGPCAKGSGCGVGYSGRRFLVVRKVQNGVEVLVGVGGVRGALLFRDTWAL